MGRSAFARARRTAAETVHFISAAWPSRQCASPLW